METLKLDGGEGQTYGGGATCSRDLLSHAAWTHDFFTAPAAKDRILQACKD
jgi:hypothetical protein